MSLLIAAPASGAGKTTITLGLLRALTRAGVPIRSAKLGPDFIDPRFHEAATGAPCPNLDPWAMRGPRLRALAGSAPLIVEGAMGLYDGANGERAGSGEDLAERLGLYVVLVLDCARASRSIAAVAEGMVRFGPGLRFGGLILNNTGSERHERMLRAALDRPRLPKILGVVRRDPRLAHPGRHLGLVQAEERADLEDWLDTCAEIIGASVDLNEITRLASSDRLKSSHGRGLRPLGQRIAVARDRAFAFCYPHLLDDWRRAGAELSFFSALADEAPDPSADAVYLPGGYPELHAGRIAAATHFLSGLRKSAQTAVVYGECGGYMVMGQGLIDAEGTRHAMAGLLPLETSFSDPMRHLGYRRATAAEGPLRGHYTAHEFHYSTQLAAKGVPLFEVSDAAGTQLGPAGLRQGSVMGSYLHLIDRDDPPLDGASAHT